LKELNIELICANSPQAKGRVERLFNTLQDRLVKEANDYLPKYIKIHNHKFGVEATRPEDRHKKIEEREILGEILCYKTERTVSKNLEISYEGRILQLETDKQTNRLRRAKVMVIEKLDGVLKIEYQGKGLNYKELLVRSHQGEILDRKQVLGTTTSPLKRRVI